MKYYYLIYIILLYFVTGCEGIRGSGGTVDEPSTTKTNKVFKGKVSQYNSDTHEITINGVEILSQGAEIYRNSAPISEDNIRAGQIVSVETNTSSKRGKFSALKIEIEDQLQGPVEAIDLELSTLTILGQTVHVTLSTSFTQKTFKTLRVNYYLAIFGFRNEKGVLEATLIEFLREDFQFSKDTVKLAGEVAQVDLDSGKIVVEGVEIALDEVKIKEIKVGDILSLNGLSINTDTPNTLTAKPVEAIIQSEIKAYELDSEVVLEGLPQKITSSNVFILNGYQVTVPTELLEANNITSVERRKVIVSGKFTAEKEVLAISLRVEQIKDFEFRGLLSSTEVENVISVFDKKIEVNIYTFIDFNLADALKEITAGLPAKTVYVKGYVDIAGKRVATTISLNPDDHEQYEFIKGKIESIENDILVISGVSFRLNGFVIFKNEDRQINSADLMKLLAVGDRVEIYGGFAEDKVFLAYFLTQKGTSALDGEKSEVKSKK